MASADRFARFKPECSIAFLLDPNAEKLLKPWHLAQLLGYALLDQRRKLTSSNRLGELTTGQARSLGVKVLSRVADVGLLGSEKSKHFELGLTVFKTIGGFERFERRARTVTLMQRLSGGPVTSLIRITEAICRANSDPHAAELNSAKLGVVWAYAFLARPGCANTILQDVWRARRHGAAYALAFAPFVEELRAAPSTGRKLAAFDRLANNQREITSLLGHAAFIADGLKQQLGNAGAHSHGHFQGVKRIEVTFRPFNDVEKAMIAKYQVKHQAPLNDAKSKQQSKSGHG